jgi:hypothetical protein
MGTDEMLSAAVEVTRTTSIPPIEDAFDAALVSVPRNSWLSALAVACQYRAEHPADDDLPVTENWLRSVGFRDYLIADKHCSSFLSLWVEPRLHNCAFLAVHWARDANPQGHYWSANDFTLYRPAHPKTRGDVRRLCAALGHPLKEERQHDPAQ